MTLPLPFTADEAQKAWDEWTFNCGPGALCAVLGKTPEEIRPHLCEFERKRYTNPSLMASILKGLGVEFERVYQCLGARKAVDPVYPDFGLVRVQWGGPWTKEGVPVRVRYRHTHWIAISKVEEPEGGAPDGLALPWSEVFDVNAVGFGGWLPAYEWEKLLVPWLLKEVEPKASGEWWPTHCWGLERPS